MTDPLPFIRYAFIKPVALPASSPWRFLSNFYSSGYWDHDNLQTFCLKKSAYDDAGAYDILDDKRDEWSENAALYARFVKLKFAVSAVR